jgi:SAM-dependent methyltransferase
VLIETARAGIEIVGVELSGEMLRRAEERLAEEPAEVRERVRLVRGDIRTVEIPRPEGGFPLITAPFRVVQHLLTRDDQKAWLRNVARHLRRPGSGSGADSGPQSGPESGPESGPASGSQSGSQSGSESVPDSGPDSGSDVPGGALIFDVFQPDYGMIAETPFIAVDVERTDPGTGATIRRVSRSEHHPGLQTFDCTFEWLVHRPGDPAGIERTEHTVHTTVRWYTLPELENLLELEGFELIETWGAFDRTPFGEDAEDIILHARLAG